MIPRPRLGRKSCKGHFSNVPGKAGDPRSPRYPGSGRPQDCRRPGSDLLSPFGLTDAPGGPCPTAPSRRASRLLRESELLCLKGGVPRRRRSTDKLVAVPQRKRNEPFTASGTHLRNERSRQARKSLGCHAISGTRRQSGQPDLRTLGAGGAEAPGGQDGGAFSV